MHRDHGAGVLASPRTSKDTSMRRIVAFFPAAVLAAAAPAAAQAPLKTLAKPDVEYSEPFTTISALRELRDGRVIVSDIRDKTVQLVDLRAGSAQKIGREGSGPGEYALPARLLALPGDTSVVYDPLNRRFLTIGPDGRPGAFVSYESDEPGGRGGVRLTLGARYTDARGRLYSQAPNFSIGPDGAPTSADTAAIIRFDRATKKTDTLAWVHVPTTTIRSSQGGTNVSIRAGGGNPFSAVDDWAVTPDGRVAVVRTKDYHVDWYSPNGQKTSGPAVAYQKIKVTEEDKKQWRERQASGGGGTAFVVTQQAGPGGTSSSAGVAPPSSLRLPEPTDWPEVKPAFVGQAAAAAPNGQLWVLRTRAANDKVPTYDVFDATGRVVSRVALPPSTRLVGFGNGTVYLARSDEDDLQYLQRYKLP
jgi:hypothetical protein